MLTTCIKITKFMQQL